MAQASEKVAETNIPSACKAHPLDVSDNFADALNDSVAQSVGGSAENAYETTAEKVGSAWLPSKNSSRSNNTLAFFGRGSRDDEQAGLTMAPLVRQGTTEVAYLAGLK